MATSKTKVNQKIRDVRSDLARAIDCVTYEGKSDWADLQKANIFLQSAMLRLRDARQELDKLTREKTITA